MQRTLVRTALAILVLLPPGTAAAQEPPDTTPRVRRPTVHLLPSVGRFGGAVVGEVADPGAPEGSAGIYHEATTAFGLAAEVSTPLRWLDVRASFVYSRPYADLEPMGDYTVSRTSVKIGTVDLIARGRPVLDARPYVLAGAGVTHYDFKQSAYRGGGHPVFDDRLVRTLHLGAGVTWDVSRYSLYAEGGVYKRPIFLAGEEAFRYDTHSDSDAYFSLGLRIPIR